MNQLLLPSLPLLILLATPILILLLRPTWKAHKGEHLIVIAVAGLMATIWYSWRTWLGGGWEPSYMLLFDRLGAVTVILLAIASGVALISAYNYVEDFGLPLGEIASLILFATLGMSVMVSSNNLFVIFVGLEILSVSAYVMAGINKSDPASNEAAVKYFILGALSSAILLMGLAFYYGATGTLDIANCGLRIADCLSIRNPQSAIPNLQLLAIALIIVGFGFKCAVVPFQWWTPDVYQGAPLPITTFFATGVKAGAFIALLRIVIGVASFRMRELDTLFAWLAVATMTFGNLAALFQDDLKRMLAYSSIAHAGYILIAFVFLGRDPVAARTAIMYYLLAYIFMTAGAFVVLTTMQALTVSPFPPEADPPLEGATAYRFHEDTSINSLSGLGRASPWLALVFTIFLLSLIGIPPTAGFFAKFNLFKGAIENGYTWLVVVAVLNSLVSVYYYTRPVVAMYFSGADRQEPLVLRPSSLVPRISLPLSHIGVLTFLAILTLAIGIWPSVILGIF